MKAIENYSLPKGRSLGLKVVWADGRPEFVDAPKGFRWNLTLGGETEAPDWNSEPECGRGLHLWTWAQGDTSVSRIWGRSDVVWMAVEYETADAVDLGGKIKVPRCRTIAVSPNRKEVVSFIQARTPEDLRGPSMDEKVVEVEEGDVEAGDKGIAIVRGKGKAMTGKGGTAIACDGGTAIANDFGVATAGGGGTAIAGFGGIAEAGDGGIAIAGYRGIAKAGKGGKVKAGEGGIIYLMSKQGGVHRWVSSHQPTWINTPVSQPLKPDTFYKLDDLGDFVEAGG